MQPCLSGHSMPVSFGSGGWIGDPAGGDDYSLVRMVAAMGMHAAHMIFCIIQYALYLLPYDGTLEMPLQCGANVRRPVRYRKDAPAPLCFQWHTAFFKKFYYIGGRKAVQSAV